MKKILLFALAGLLTLGAMSSCTKEDGSVPVVGVKLDPAVLTLGKDASQTLTVNFLPEKATNKNVTWSSSDPAVASVDATGLVTAILEGTTTITVTTEDGNKTATCVVTIVPDVILVESVSLNKESLEIDAGATETLTATILPTNAANKAVTWSSSDEAVATVADGVVTAVAPGTATITVTTADGEKTATCAVTVTSVDVTGVTLNESAISLVVATKSDGSLIGAAGILIPVIAPENATNKTVTWTSSDEAVAVVNNGIVSALTVGTATITATTVEGEFTATSTVTVTDVADLSGLQDFETGNALNYMPNNPANAVFGFTAAGEGADGIGRALTLTNAEVQAESYGTQLLFMIPEAEVGKKYKFSMDIKSDAPATFDTQTQGAPSEYIHYTAVGDVKSDIEWKHHEWVGTIETAQAGFKTIAFNVGKTATTYYFDNITWSEVISEQNFEGDDATNYSTQGVAENDNQGREYVVNVETEFTAAGEGANGAGRALEVTWTVVDDAATLNSHDVQFFYELGEEVVVGETYIFSMWIKSDTPATVETQWHRTPGDYLWYETPVGNIETTTEWQHIEKKITIPENAAGAGTLAFNLNKALAPNTYYFDNIVWSKPAK